MCISYRFVPGEGNPDLRNDCKAPLSQRYGEDGNRDRGKKGRNIE